MRCWPKDARRNAGHQLHLVQQGLEPFDWKPIPTVGMGVNEIRVRTAQEYRLFYVAKFSEGVYILHVFEKRTRRTSAADIELGRQRLREAVRLRRSERFGT